MKLEDQLVSFPVSIRLEKLGVKQDSEFIWSVNPMTEEVILTGNAVESIGGIYCKTYSAFSVEELGEKLKIIPFEIKWSITWNQWEVYDLREGGEHYPQCRPGNMVNPLAEMLIYLLEHKLVKAEEL